MTGFSDLITDNASYVVILMIIITAFFILGVPNIDQDTGTSQFESDSEATQAQEYIEQNFTSQNSDNTVTTQVVQRSENALSKESILQMLEIERDIVESADVAPTLESDNPVLSLSSVIAQSHIQKQLSEGSSQYARPINISDKVDAVESMNQDEINETIESIISPDSESELLGLLPRSYEVGQTVSASQMMLINHNLANEFESQQSQSPQEPSDQLSVAQEEISDIANGYDESYAVFGSQLLSGEIQDSFIDSVLLVGPMAFIFVVVTLIVAYRDLIDILLGGFGIATVLMWTFGFMGWFGISFNQIIISAPILLIGLSIDYSIHVFMRQREKRQEDEELSVQNSMRLALIGVGTALIWVTATAAIGFLANLVSPLGPLRDFGIVSSFGILSALVVFTTFIPSLKILIDGFLESKDFDRAKTAFGTGGSFVSKFLSLGGKMAADIPYIVLALTVVLSGLGVYGASQVDTSFKQQDFLAEDPNELFKQLPGPFAPNDYEVKSDLNVISGQFQQEGSQAQILVSGNITRDETLNWIDKGIRETSLDDSSVIILPDGTPSVTSINSAMKLASESDENFSDIYNNSDTDDDGLPDENLDKLYSEYSRLPQSSEIKLLQQSDSGFESTRLIIDVNSASSNSEISSDISSIADNIEKQSGSQINATATGSPVVGNDVESALFETVIQGLIITLVASLIFITISYGLVRNSFVLGVITLIPVYISVTWILGTMNLLGIPFNAITGSITSLTIGLGIAYSIHISSRYQIEIQKSQSPASALDKTLKGTGGALLGSVATTVAGFGTLAFAIFPILRQFGIITGISVIYSFIASIFILPTLLIIWTKLSESDVQDESE